MDIAINGTHMGASLPPIGSKWWPRLASTKPGVVTVLAHTVKMGKPALTLEREGGNNRTTYLGAMYVEHKPRVGIGERNARVGTKPWAEWMRMVLQNHVKDLSKEPDFVWTMLDSMREHRAWTLLTKPDGSHFATFEEFCETPLRHGLGKPWSEIKPYLEPLLGRQAVELMTHPVKTDARQENGTSQERDERGRMSRKNSGGTDSRSDCGNRCVPRSEQYIAAILRAPEQVQELYKQGRISQVAAAKLGPRPPKRGLAPERAAEIAETTQRVLALASQGASMREVSKAVMQPQDPADRLLRALDKLPHDSLRKLRRRIDELLKKANS